jgi:hypothetical protein
MHSQFNPNSEHAVHCNKQMLDAEITTKLLDLLNDGTDVNVKSVPLLLSHIAEYFDKTTATITKRQFHDFLKIIWKVLEFDEEFALEHAMQALCKITCLEHNYNRKFDVFNQISNLWKGLECQPSIFDHNF